MASDILTSGFSCDICGKHHDTLPLAYSVKAPRAALLIPAEELEKRVVLSADQCVVDGRDIYLRGRIVVPIVGQQEPFVWGVWAEISPKSFLRVTELWKQEGREQEPPFPGWLDSEILPFGDTINLELQVHTQKIGSRPHFTVADPDHPLAIEQRGGIPLSRVKQIAEKMLHG